MKNISFIRNINANYALLHHETATIEPYIVAWKYDPKDKTWAQGHYFQTLEEAERYAETLA